MSDQGEHYHRQHTNRVSSTSDVRMGQRNQMFARSPHPSHSSGLERVEEESSAVVDSSTDHKYRPAYMYSNHHGMEQQNVSHGNMTFKRSTQQGYFRFPITPPYYDNRYSCTNPMCRETQYCYEHQINPYISSSVPMPSSPFMHDCSFPRQVCRKSPLLLNQNAIKSRVEDDVLRPKHEWPIAYRSNHIMPDPPTPTTPAQHLATLFNNKDNTSIPPSTATSLRSSNLEPFMHPSNFPSPRQSARLTRKRAMSTSPALSIDSIDINSLIRTSPDSLIAYINAPRLSSAGSYGHLSASGISPSPKPPRSSLMRSPMFGCWQTTPTLGLRPMSSQHSDQKDKEPEVKQAIVKEENTCSDKDIKQEKNEKEDNMIVDEKLPSFTSYTETDKRESDAENEENNEGVGGKDKNNNKFLCQWKDCNILFQTQEDLVKHVNTDHIKKEKRDFTCHWIDCQREQKPFKAQYMLVVHMRRHTGEKPNKCSFKGCNKAYSRLENLKTHERSHTGERPYVCEFENCTKAFTNASDRAKHQNRTHSSVKPYICTVEGCTKRYTDPSSLRKHKKTCHPEHFNGAKKPKVDEGKRKQPSEGTKNVAGEIKSSTTNNSSIKRKTQISNHSNRTGDQSSTGSKDPKDSGQGKNMLNLQPAEFSPQSFSGELTSSSSCVDSPHSTHVACEETDENPISPATVGTQNKSNTSSKSPKANELRSVPDRREMPELGLGGGGDVLVENPIVPNRLSLPTINKQNDVGKWVADVTQSMNHVNRYPNELRENYAVDYSSRRSSESGVSSYISSRRSSEMSTVTKQPYTTVPTVVEETVNDIFSPNKHTNDAQKQQQFPPINQWNPRHSPAPDALHMEQRRSSSGYGSHHNLAVIRSPVFHKVPMQNSTEPLPNRRMSDSIICEADSSNRYLPIKNNNMGSRRSSEPVSNYYSNGSSDLHSQYYPQIRQNGSSDLHSQYYPQSMQNIQHTLESNYGPHNMINNHRAHSRPQPLDRGQKLTHYPYSIEQRNSPYQPNPPNHNVRCKPPQPNLQQTTNLWQHEHHINQQLLKVRDGESQCSILPGQIYQNDVSGSTMNQQPGVECDRIVNNHGAEGSYESMLNGINNLNTNDMAQDPGLQNIPSNMVINDMNTLLNSLIEEERYLDKNQAQNNMTSMLSHIF